jgi:GNAT superfamily N-acetyltransferase
MPDDETTGAGMPDDGTTDDGVTMGIEPAEGEGAVAAREGFFAELARRYADRGGAAPPPVDPAELEAPDGAMIVVRLDGAPLGCGGLRRLDAETCEVKRVYLAAELRGRGLSRRLMERLHEEARALGYRRVRLDTGSAQPEAKGLYTSLGYREIDDYNGNPMASFWFEREL